MVHCFGVGGDEIVDLRSTRGIHPSGSLPFGGRENLPRTTLESGRNLRITLGSGHDGPGLEPELLQTPPGLAGDGMRLLARRWN
jgi:hypothetical protein